MRLIDAEAFEDLFHKQMEYGVTDVFDAVEDALQDTPTIDAVSVIRCKDCKHALSTTGDCVKCTMWHEWMPSNGFCSEGGKAHD